MSKRRAEERAYEVLRTFECDFQRADLPIPVEDIARGLNIKITFEPFDGSLSGVLYRDEHDTIIGVNSSESDQRKRFTIAHELGHFVMHEGEEALHVDQHQNFKVNFRNATSSLAIDLREIEANAFAAALLMPEELVRKAFEDFTDGIDLSSDLQIEELANLFNVSQQALLIRLVNLQIFEP